MYLTPNFDALTVPSYIKSQSASVIVNILSSWELRQAARNELLKHSPRIDEESLYEDADRAFRALDSVMKRKQEQNVPGRPSLLEASLFSYLFLLLELPREKWADGRLVDLLMKYPGLVALEKMMKKDFMISEAIDIRSVMLNDL
jgi:metaxin